MVSMDGLDPCPFSMSGNIVVFVLPPNAHVKAWPRYAIGCLLNRRSVGFLSKLFVYLNW